MKAKLLSMLFLLSISFSAAAVETICPSAAELNSKLPFSGLEGGLIFISGFGFMSVEVRVNEFPVVSFIRFRDVRILPDRTVQCAYLTTSTPENPSSGNSLVVWLRTEQSLWKFAEDVITIKGVCGGNDYDRPRCRVTNQ